MGSIPGSGRSPEGGHGNPLQYSCLENPMDRGAWQGTVYSVTKVEQDLSDLAQHSTTFKDTVCNGLMSRRGSHSFGWGWQRLVSSTPPRL